MRFLKRVPPWIPLPVRAWLSRMGVWQGVAFDFPKHYPGLPCPTLLHPVGGPHLKQPYSRFRDCPPTGGAVCGCLLLLRTFHAVRPHPTPHAVRLCFHVKLFVLWIVVRNAGQYAYGVGYPRRYKMAARCPPCGRATPETAIRLFWGVAHPLDVEGSGIAGQDETLGSPWIPLPIQAC